MIFLSLLLAVTQYHRVSDQVIGCCRGCDELLWRALDGNERTGHRNTLLLHRNITLHNTPLLFASNSRSHQYFKLAIHSKVKLMSPLPPSPAATLHTISSSAPSYSLLFRIQELTSVTFHSSILLVNSGALFLSVHPFLCNLQLLKSDTLHNEYSELFFGLSSTVIHIRHATQASDFLLLFHFTSKRLYATRSNRYDNLSLKKKKLR